MWLINTPKLIRGLWKMVSTLLDEFTQSKISIDGSHYKEKLITVIDEEKLEV